MTTSTETARPEPTAQDMVDYLKKKALRDITFAAHNLDRVMNQMSGDIARAKEAMRTGNRIRTGITNHGPFGSQSPADAAMYAVQLETALALAVELGATQEELTDAMKEDLR